MARVLDGGCVGETDDQFLDIAKAVLAQAGQGGVRIDIRDIVVVQLHAADIRGAASISANISGLAQAGHEEVAEALKWLTEAVTHCTEIAAAQRSELLELLDELSRQAVLTPSERAKPGVIKGILAALATGLQAAGGLAEVWSTWGHTIQGFFGA